MDFFFANLRNLARFGANERNINGIEFRFVRFLRRNNNCPCLGLISKDGLSFVDFTLNPVLPQSLIQILTMENLMKTVMNEISHLKFEKVNDDVKFLCPVEPLRILSVEHILMNSTTKMFKDIPLNAIVGPNTNGFLTKNIREAVYLPGFGVIVGREASKIVASDAMRYVFGYVPLVKVRPLKFLSNYKKDQIPELYLPIGKSIAHKALIQDSQNINSSLKINGRKFSQTKINIKTIVSNLIEFISEHVTLSSGDMIAVDFSDPIAGQFYSGTHSHGSESIEYDLETIGRLEQISRI